MNLRIGTLLAILTAAACTVASAADSSQLARLDAALPGVATFEYGKDSGPLRTVEDIVIALARDPQQRAAVEERLLQVLSGNATRDAKEFICRQLFTIGTARSVPVLENLLTDPALSHIARFALGRMEYPAASEALLRALHKTSGKLQVGIIGTLGDRRYSPAMPELARLFNMPDASIAGAAVKAVGKIGGNEAVKNLEAAQAGASAALRPRIDDALLACADRFLSEGDTRAADRIYERFLAADQPRQLRVAALRGLILSGTDESLKRLVAAIQGPDEALRPIAIGFVRTAPGGAVTTAAADLLSVLPPSEQTLLLSALGERGDAAAAPSVMNLAKNGDPSVRAAAYEALGRVGNGSTVEFLATAAATSSGAEQSAARAALVRLKGDDINGALIRILRSPDPKTQVEGIRALSGRRAHRAAGELVRLARANDASVRKASITALGVVVAERDLPALVDLVAKPMDARDRGAAEQAVEAAFRRIPEAESRARPVLAALPGADGEAKASLLRLLTWAATPSALEAVRAGLKDTNPDVREAALRALADWPNPDPTDDLLGLARATPDRTQKVLALRGYIRLAGLSKDPTSMYARALELAESPADKKLVLGGLGTASSPEALSLVEKYLNDESLQAEAASATVQIADRLRQKDAALARSALQTVVASAKDPAIRQKAQDVLNELDKYQGYILTWLVAGPYQAREKDGRAAFDTAFAPEQPDSGDVTWKPLSKGVGAWDINLEGFFGSMDHCAAYVRTRVWSPIAQDARLEMGSDDAEKAWLNGTLVHGKYQNRSLEPRQDIVKVSLHEGWNDLRLKVVDHEGGWAFCCRIRRPDGAAIQGLKFEAK